MLIEGKVELLTQIGKLPMPEILSHIWPKNYDEKSNQYQIIAKYKMHIYWMLRVHIDCEQKETMYKEKKIKK